MDHLFKKIDHVQLTAPTGSEYEAREFYEGVLGMKEIEKPEALADRGGTWFQFNNYQLHIGIEEPFSPAKKSHPAFEVAALSQFMQLMEENNVSYEEDDLVPGVNRIFINDPFGNRIEVLEKIDD